MHTTYDYSAYLDNDTTTNPNPSPYHYYYICMPYALQNDSRSRRFENFGDDPDDPLTIELPHLPYIQPPSECLALGSWMTQVVSFYSLTGILDDKKGSHPHHAMITALKGYRHNSFTEFNDYFTRGILVNKERIVSFIASFSAFGCSLPRSQNWTLFTGEGAYGSELWSRCLESKKNDGLPVKVPMQLSTTWNFNVALHFMGNHAGGIVALHYTANPGTKFQVMAHLLQELASYDNITAKPEECEILLQPGLTIRFLREETVPRGLHARALRCPGPSRYPVDFREFSIMHVEIVDAV